MRRFVVIATANRGAVDPPEPLDEADQYRAERQAQICDQQDIETLRQRATYGYQLERDPLYDSTRAKSA